jgi:hypothetical protein
MRRPLPARLGNLEGVADIFPRTVLGRSTAPSVTMKSRYDNVTVYEGTKNAERYEISEWRPVESEQKRGRPIPLDTAQPVEELLGGLAETKFRNFPEKHGNAEVHWNGWLWTVMEETQLPPVVSEALSAPREGMVVMSRKPASASDIEPKPCGDYLVHLPPSADLREEWNNHHHHGTLVEVFHNESTLCPGGALLQVFRLEDVARTLQRVLVYTSHTRFTYDNDRFRRRLLRPRLLDSFSCRGDQGFPRAAILEEAGDPLAARASGQHLHVRRTRFTARKHEETLLKFFPHLGPLLRLDAEWETYASSSLHGTVPAILLQQYTFWTVGSSVTEGGAPPRSPRLSYLQAGGSRGNGQVSAKNTAGDQAHRR